ncbi:metallopeptidase TldD-related protein [Niabella insulamsoli]|uniref:metallopeptidase TldD-related protein n=1 Tax=Niabella insulamsoli TaxID=3144874 RepID=UPI0031FC6C9D
MRYKIVYSALFLLLLTTALSAQQLTDNFYVRVLQQELKRNIERLHLPDLEKPFFVAYQLRNQNTFSINGERGQITSTATEPVNNQSASVKVRVGDYHRNFDYMMYDGSFINLPDETNADEYRRLLWLETDKAYKNNARQYSGFVSSLKRVIVDESELALDDMAKVPAVVKDFGEASPITVDKATWRRHLEKLSKLFNKYPQITTSYCRLMINSYEDYMVSSEGTIVRRPGGYVSLTAVGATTDEQGVTTSDDYSITVASIDELPSLAALEIHVTQLIDRILLKQKAKPFEGSYMGPVLFTGNAATDLVYQCFAAPLQTRRKSIMGYGTTGVDYEEKLGQKLIASELTLKAIPSLKMVDGKHTTGSFPIDDEGVIPVDSLTLIEGGILKALLNGRTPTKRFPFSQGFARSFIGRGCTAGVLKLSSSKTAPADSMVARLIKVAKEEGLPAAYIVKKLYYSAPEIYKLDVATGDITLVNQCRITPLSLKSLRRFIVASDQTILENMAQLSLVAPESLLINEVEIEKNEVTSRPKPIIVSNPLLLSSVDKTPAVRKAKKGR